MMTAIASTISGVGADFFLAAPPKNDWKVTGCAVLALSAGVASAADVAPFAGAVDVGTCPSRRIFPIGVQRHVGAPLLQIRPTLLASCSAPSPRRSTRLAALARVAPDPALPCGLANFPIGLQPHVGAPLVQIRPMLLACCGTKCC